jgi:regulatory protein
MAAEETTALQRAVGFLSRREHSRHELRWKLSERDYAEEEIEAALERLIQKGLQSDERFAEAYITSRVQRGHGPYKITAELKQRGVEEGLISQLMIGETPDWFEHALNVYKKKYAGKPVADFKDRAKRSRFLQQRGFSSEQIQYALETSQGN